MKIKTYQAIAVAGSMLVVSTGLWAGPPTVNDVGDADSFGHPAKFMGAVGGFVTLSPTACPATPSPSPGPGGSSECFQLNPAPAQTSFEADDICRVKLPKGSTKDNIYPVLGLIMSYQLQNSTGSPQPHGIYSIDASISIESTVLNDPSIIDPLTGMPANGKIQTGYTYAYRDDRTMQDGDRQRLRQNVARVGNTGITKAQLVASGLPQNVVDKLFNSDMTIHVDVTGTATLVTDAFVTINLRLFGD
jgi:hypothetical protein